MHAPFSKTRTDHLPAIIAGLFTLGSATTVFYMPVFFSEELKFSGAQIGMLFALLAVCGVLASFPAGLGNDRITSRTLIGIGLSVQAAILILMGYVRSFPFFAAIFFIWALANNLFRISLEVQLLKTDQGTHTGRRFGNFAAIRFFGLALGTVLAGYLLALLDFRYSFYFVAVMCLLLLWAVRLLPPTKIAQVRLAEYRADFSNPRIILLAIWVFIFCLHWGVEHTCYSLFLRHEFRLPTHLLGWYMSAEFFAVVLAAFFIGRRIKQNGPLLDYMIVGVLLSGIGHIGMVYPPVYWSVAFRAIHGLGDGLIIVIFYLGLAQLFAVERVGGSNGIANLAMMLGMVTSALIAGPAGERFGYGLPIWISGFLLIALTLPLLWIRLIRPAPQAVVNGSRPSNNAKIF